MQWSAYPHVCLGLRSTPLCTLLVASSVVNFSLVVRFFVLSKSLRRSHAHVVNTPSVRGYLLFVPVVPGGRQPKALTTAVSPTSRHRGSCFERYTAHTNDAGASTDFCKRKPTGGRRKSPRATASYVAFEELDRALTTRTESTMPPKQQKGKKAVATKKKQVCGFVHESRVELKRCASAAL